MEVYTSDSSDNESREMKTLDFGRMSITTEYLEHEITTILQATNHNNREDIETILLHHNRLTSIPSTITLENFMNLKILDLSSNLLTQLPDAICQLPHLITLIIKNNLLTNESLPKSMLCKYNTNINQHKNGLATTLRELNLSGNKLTHFPEQVFELRNLRYLYLGGNQITGISKDIRKMTGLQILSIGGNLLTEVPETLGTLSQLQALVLCDNLIEFLPTSIAHLKNLKSLLLHKNRLRHLPKDIVALQNLTELSLRDNPLVVRFVQDMALNPSLMELAARVVVRESNIQYGPKDLPKTVLDYLGTANCCVNPKCTGVFFDNRVEHIKFVDFCGKYRVPLLQYLCSSKCIKPASQCNFRVNNSGGSGNSSTHPEPGASGYMMKKVLLG